MRPNKDVESVRKVLSTGSGTLKVVPSVLIEFPTDEFSMDVGGLQESLEAFAKQMRYRFGTNVKIGERFAEQNGTYGFRQVRDAHHGRAAKRLHTSSLRNS